MEGVNDKDFLVKVYFGYEYLVIDFGYEINCKVMYLFLCVIIFL